MKDGRSNHNRSEVPSNTDLSYLDLNNFSTCLDNIDMWRQDVSKSQIPDGEPPGGAMVEAGQMSMERLSYFPNGHGQLGMPEFTENQSFRTKEVEYPGSLPTRTSTTDGTFSNVESMSTMSTFSPGMEPVTASSSQGFTNLDVPALTSLGFGNMDPSTNQRKEIRPRPQGEVPHYGVHQHHPDCPRAGRPWYPPPSHSSQLTIDPSQGPQTHTSHAQYTRFGGWQQAPPNAHPAQVPALNPAALSSSAPGAASIYIQGQNGQAIQRPEYGPTAHSLAPQTSQNMSHAALAVPHDHNTIHDQVRSQEVKDSNSVTSPSTQSRFEGHQIHSSSSAAAESPSYAESETSQGRSSEYYHMLPHGDGKYHCPFAGTGCGHEPVKLKCNYDKYIDSHLKPYRCRIQGCEELRFSSTACQLRHEREAHGKYGHGMNPYLCEFQGCERSSPQAGFPRAWNCKDHMRRCHNFTGPLKSDSINTPVSPKTVEGKQKAKGGNRKRSSAGVTPKSSKRSKSTAEPSHHSFETTPALFVPSEPAEQINAQSLHNEWHQRRLRLAQMIHHLNGPEDVLAHQQLRGDIDAMHKIAEQLKTV